MGKIWGNYTFVPNMATFSYIIKANKTADFAKVYLRLRDGRDIDQTASTHIAVLPQLWDKRRETIVIRGRSELNNTDMVGEAQTVIDRLDGLRDYVTRHYSAISGCRVGKNWLKEAISAWEKTSIAGRDIDMNLTLYIEQYIADYQSGARKTIKGTDYSPATITSRCAFLSLFRRFCTHTGKQYDFDDITPAFYSRFLDWCNARQYSPNTFGKQIKILKGIMAAAKQEKLHTNEYAATRAFRPLSCESDTIYLNRQEVTAIERLNLSEAPDLDICRDVFLSGIYTAQRFSDYHRIGKENIITLDNGREAVRLTQQKTKHKVIIPVGVQLAAILDKYDGHLPIVSNSTENVNIKEVCRLAGITQKVEHTKVVGSKAITEYIEKYRLVSSHTARRTGATLMYLEGVDTLSIMKITGHRTESEFRKYIRVGEEENALLLSNNTYYNRPNDDLTNHEGFRILDR